MDNFTRKKWVELIGTDNVKKFPSIQFQMEQLSNDIEEIISLKVIWNWPYAINELWVEHSKTSILITTNTSGDFRISQIEKETWKQSHAETYSSHWVNFFIFILLAYREKNNKLPDVYFPKQGVHNKIDEINSERKSEICTSFLSPDIQSYLYFQSNFKTDKNGIRRLHISSWEEERTWLWFLSDKVILKYDFHAHWWNAMSKFIFKDKFLPLYAQMYCDVKSIPHWYDFPKRIYDMTELILQQPGANRISSFEARKKINENT